VYSGEYPNRAAASAVILRRMGMAPDIHPQRRYGFGGDGFPVPEELPGAGFQDDPAAQVALTHRQVRERSEEQIRHAVAGQHVCSASQHQGRGIADGVQQLP